MKWKQFTWKVRYFWQYFPFTINTALCAIAIWAAYKLLYKPVPKGEDPSAFLPFIIIMGKLSLWFVVVLASVSVVSTLFSFFYYLWLKSKKGVYLQVEFTLEQKNHRENRLFMSARLDGVIRPVLGFVKGRLFYDDNLMTDRFGLLSDKRNEQSFWRSAITGRSRLKLPDIKEYDLKGGFIFFQDMLHIFSLAVVQPVTGHFYQPPVTTEGHDATVSPKKTESLDVRIEQLRRVEGEHLNYKDFESGDDVRRIVWKVYAKNRELVVRVPELYEPYASHLYLFASFHAGVKGQWLNEGYLKEMLNHYKNCVWTIYETLSRKEWEMRFIPDQSFTIPDQLTNSEKTARIISNSSWQKDNSLQQYFNPKTGAVLIISSLVEPDELVNTLDRCDASTVVYFIKISNVLKYFAPLGWLSRLLFQPPEDRLSKLKASWTFSPLRIQIQKREKLLESILEKSHVASAVI